MLKRMAEGVAVSGGTVVSGATFDDPQREPPADPGIAPRGWTWARTQRAWRPRKSAGRPPKNPGDSEPKPPAGKVANPFAPGEPESDRDPDPSWVTGETRPPEQMQLPFAQVPKQVKDDIAGFAGLIGTPILALIQSVDPYCGGALMQCFEPAVDAALPLLCRSERIVRYFSEDTSDWLLWGKLAIALAPVGRAVLAHHVLRTVEVTRNPETGQATVGPRRRGPEGHGPHLQPPVQPEPDPSAYVV